MAVIFIILGLACFGGGLYCTVRVLIDAFDDELWKGLLAVIFPLYYLYYALFEYEEENKWVIVLLSLAGNSAGLAFLGMGLGSTAK